MHDYVDNKLCQGWFCISLFRDIQSALLEVQPVYVTLVLELGDVIAVLDPACDLRLADVFRWKLVAYAPTFLHYTPLRELHL